MRSLGPSANAARVAIDLMTAAAAVPPALCHARFVTGLFRS